MNSEVWQHIKSGGLYTILADDAQLEKDLSRLVIYKSLWDDAVWVRPYDEFHDGRFRNISIEEITDVREEDDRE